MWQIEDNEDGTVSFVNEGNKYIMTPGNYHYDKVDGQSKRDAGYLHYNPNRDVRYEVGDADGDDENRKFEWLPGSATSITGGTTSNFVFTASTRTDSTFYMFLDKGWKGAYDENENMTQADHVLKSGTIQSIATKESRPATLLWTIEPITAEDEEAMFRADVDGLAGYVGGVVTLSNVSNAQELSEILMKAEDYASAIGTGYNTKPGAQLMEDLLCLIDPLADNGSGYFQKLSTDKPFFLENMCGYRPSYGARLKQGAGYSSAAGWITVDKGDVDQSTTDGIFYAEDAGTVNGESAQTLHIVSGTTLKYISASDTNTATTGVATTETAAMKFTIDPIIPGVWQIRDLERNGKTGNDAKKYMTITVNGSVYSVVHYEISEPSTLWKFKTYNELKLNYNLDPDASPNDEGKYVAYASFGSVLDSRLLKADGATVPYAASEIYVKDNTLRVVMDPLPTYTVDGVAYYYLQNFHGYLFKRTCDTKEDAIDNSGKPRSDVEGTSGDKWSFYEDIEGNKNYLQTRLSTITLQNDGGQYDWQKYFAFTYVEKGKVYSHYDGEPVSGFGVGFYRLAPGRKIEDGKAFLTWDDIQTYGKTDDSLEMPASKGVVLVFLDENGETDDVMTIDAEGNLTHAKDVIYDLSGREVVNPCNGIFIKNGKKIFVK